MTNWLNWLKIAPVVCYNLPWTTSSVVASNNPLGKAVMLQLYKPASALFTFLMIRDCSISRTLSFRDVSWILSPCWLLKTRMMFFFPSGVWRSHWNCVILLICDPWINWHGRVTSCLRCPVTLGWTWTFCASRAAKQHTVVVRWCQGEEKDRWNGNKLYSLMAALFDLLVFLNS